MGTGLGSSSGARGSVRAFTRIAGVALLVLSDLGGFGCSEHNRVELAFGDRPEAFRCRDYDAPNGGVDLAQRAACVGFVTLVVDFIPLEGGVPACFSGEIKAWCQDHEHGCNPIEGRRRSMTVRLEELEGAGDLSTQEAIDAVLALLGGERIVENAPDVPVIVRVVATAESESAVNTHFPFFASDHLLGCAISCPVELDEVRGSVGMDIPMLARNCVESVGFCANTKPLDAGPAGCQNSGDDPCLCVCRDAGACAARGSR